MPADPLAMRAADLDELRRDAAPEAGSWFIGTLIHLYVRLDVDRAIEFPTTAEDARQFTQIVAEAAGATWDEATCQQFGGKLLECQGLTVHAAIPDRGEYPERAREFAAAVHNRLKSKLGRFTSVRGWRMTTDAGRTLVLAGPGAHDDNSYVSIGNAANRPAKHLYQQLYDVEREEDRNLKRSTLGLRDQVTGRWTHKELERLPTPLTYLSEAAGSRERDDPRVRVLAAAALEERDTLITADAKPLAPAGRLGSPSSENPEPDFGWVMRADLDGFTQRVEVCADEDQALATLATEFLQLMAKVAAFVHEHPEKMVQLPWAGDNATLAVVMGDKDEYDGARRERLVNHFLDFDDETNAGARRDTWAYAVCGGDMHGNASGNVWIGGVEFGPVRFLVGAGVGFSRSLEAFAKVKPDGGCVDVLSEDAATAVQRYRDCFAAAENENGSNSSVFEETDLEKLKDARDEEDTGNRSVDVTTAAGVREPVSMKPYAAWNPKDFEAARRCLPRRRDVGC